MEAVRPRLRRVEVGKLSCARLACWLAKDGAKARQGGNEKISTQIGRESERERESMCICPCSALCVLVLLLTILCQAFAYPTDLFLACVHTLKH